MYLSTVICLFLGLALFHGGESSRFCTDDSDCSDLGDLYCIKSMCNWGVCGCPRGKASHYLGSEDLFKCVPLKKIDQGCSLNSDKGLCGAPNSRCIKGDCKCKDGYESTRDGEDCESVSGRTAPTESCASNLGSCGGVGSVWQCRNTWYSAAMGSSPHTCACNKGYKTVLSNSLSMTKFPGKKLPYCRAIMIGEKCKNDYDCNAISGGECGTDFKCKCRTSGHVPDYYKTRCNLPKAHGVQCSGVGTTSGHCDGTKGLVCGDICSLATTNPATKSCKCGASYTESGSTCTPREIGASCYGDDNCKYYSENGICVDGSCADGAGQLTVGVILMVIPLANLLYSFLG